MFRIGMLLPRPRTSAADFILKGESISFILSMENYPR